MEISNLSTRKEMLEYFRPSGLGLEIGIEKGNFSKVILETCPDLTLFMLDCWDYPIENYFDRNVGSLENQRQIMVEALWNVRVFFRRVKIFKLYSEEFASMVPDNFFNFIYIDADHSDKAVKKDLELWYPKLKSGGLFAGHDYLDRLDPSCNFGTKTAVDEFCQKNNLTLYHTKSPKNIEEFHSWFLVKN